MNQFKKQDKEILWIYGLCSKFKDHNYIKTNHNIYSYIWDAQTWLLLVTYEYKFVSKPKAKPYKNLDVTTGVIVGLILYYLSLINSSISVNYLTLLSHYAHMFSSVPYLS